jgi:integrase
MAARWNLKTRTTTRRGLRGGKIRAVAYYAVKRAYTQGEKSDFIRLEKATNKTDALKRIDLINIADEEGRLRILGPGRAVIVGLAEVDQENPKLTIEDAMKRAADVRTWRPQTRHNDDFYQSAFLSWCKEQGIERWGQLRLEIIQRYKKYLIGKGFRYDSVRLYCSPIRRTSAWCHANWPTYYHHFCQTLRLKRSEFGGSTYDPEQGNPVLSIKDVWAFVRWLQSHKRWQRLAVGVALQGLGGLSLLEAYRLTWSKFNSNEGTVIVDGETKNTYRNRCIPLANVLVDMLRDCQSPIQDMTIIPQYATYKDYAKAIKKVLNLYAKVDGIEKTTKQTLLKMKAKDLRNTIQTAAIDGGWYGYYVQRYVGHAPKTIGERYYHGDEWERMMPFLRDQVVKNIEAALNHSPGE